VYYFLVWVALFFTFFRCKTIWNIRLEMPGPPYSWYFYEVFVLSSIWLLLCPVMINKCSRVTILLKWNDEEFWQFHCHWRISKAVVFSNIQQQFVWTIQVFCWFTPFLTFIYINMRGRHLFFILNEVSQLHGYLKMPICTPTKLQYIKHSGNKLINWMQFQC